LAKDAQKVVVNLQQWNIFYINDMFQPKGHLYIYAPKEIVHRGN
jgi:hypothetical protein